MRKLSRVAGELFPIPQQLSRAAGELFPVSRKLSRVTGELFPVPRQLSRVTGELFPIPRQLSRVTGEQFPVPRQLSRIAGELFPVSRQLSRVVGKLFPVPRKLFVVWRYLFRGGRIGSGVPGKQSAVTREVNLEPWPGSWERRYDVALALLESAVLLLEEGRTAEVKELAPVLAKVFKSQDIHREARRPSGLQGGGGRRAGNRRLRPPRAPLPVPGAPRRDVAVRFNGCRVVDSVETSIPGSAGVPPASPDTLAIADVMTLRLA